VTCRFSVSGVNNGPFMGMPPTGKEISMDGITILAFRDGKCVERWSQADFLSLLQQVGALPQPA
jgi:predicted ester cyclase